MFRVLDINKQKPTQKINFYILLSKSMYGFCHIGMKLTNEIVYNCSGKIGWEYQCKYQFVQYIQFDWITRKFHAVKSLVTQKIYNAYI